LLDKQIFSGKKVLLIMHYGSLGGAERQGLGLAKFLTEEYQCEVSLLLTFSDELQPDFKQFATACHIRHIFHTHAPYLVCWKELSYRNLKRLVWSFKYIWGYRKILEPYGFDYIFPFLNFPSKVAFYLYKVLPTVKFTFWHQLGLDVFKPDELFEKYASRAVPAVIANSQTGLELYKKHYELDVEKSYILPQYLTMEYLHFDKKEIRKKFNIPQDALVFGMIAHYREDKKHELILEAFKKVSENFEDVFLVFTGNRESSGYTRIKYDALEKSIREEGLDSKVRLLSQESIEEVLSSLDVGLLISEIEGMPNAVMEYMLYGLPVIASDHPGCKYLLKESTYLISNSRELLIGKMLELLNSPSERELQGLKNRELINSFTRESYVRDLSIIIKRHL